MFKENMSTHNDTRKASDTFPEATPEALSHSRELKHHIGKSISANGGKIPFSQYMNMALYEPGLGYYSAGLRKFGHQGDFVTADEHCEADRGNYYRTEYSEQYGHECRGAYRGNWYADGCRIQTVKYPADVHQ